MNRILSRNTTLIILSVIIAVGLWFEANVEQNPELVQTYKFIPVEVRNTDPTLVVLDYSPRSVDLRIRGPAAIVRGLGTGDFRAWVDLTGAKAGAGDYPVQVSLPAGVGLDEAIPQRVSVTLDTFSRKQVPVVVKTTGTVADGFLAQAAMVDPTDALVEGAQSRISLVQSVVAVVDISGAAGSVSRTVPLQAQDSTGHVVDNVTIRPATASLTVPVSALPPPVGMPVRLKLAGAPAQGYVVAGASIDPASVLVQPDGSTASARIIEVDMPPVDVTGATSDLERSVSLMTAPGVLKIDPAQVTVKVSIIKGVSKKFAGVRVVPVNLAPGLKADVTPAAVDVYVAGPASAMRRVDASQISVSVDTSGLTPGRYVVPLSITTPDGTYGYSDFVVVVVTVSKSSH